MHLTSLTCGLSGGLTPYMNPEICVRRSAMQMNFFSRFLGITNLYGVDGLCLCERCVAGHKLHQGKHRTAREVALRDA